VSLNALEARNTYLEAPEWNLDFSQVKHILNFCLTDMYNNKFVLF
jgi:hypothetical protein